jgi:hypothetical protein
MKMHFRPIVGPARISMARAIIPLCLAFTCVSAWAGTPMTGYSSDQGTSMGDRMSYTEQLPVGPAPRGPKGGINENDLGLCGVLGLSGVFSDNETLAQIIVQTNGYYGLNVNWADSNHRPPIIEWTCVRLTDFTGLPHLSDFAGSAPLPLTVNGSHFTTRNIGDLTDACIWTGLKGAFSEAPHDFLFVGAGLKGSFASPDDNELAVASAAGLTLSTYTVCSTFDVKGFSWNYYPSSPLEGGQCSLGSVSVPLPCEASTGPSPVLADEYWCSISGIYGQGPASDQGAGVEPLSVKLGIDIDPATGASIYEATVINSNAIGWDCLRFRQ